MGKHDPDDPVTMYIRDASNVEPLTKDEETNLFRRLGRVDDWGEDRENVAKRLVESQLALVVSIAQKYSASGVPMLDLIEERNIGLMDAVRSFAEKPIGNFTAHAAACIEDAIAKVLGKSETPVWRYIATTPATCKMMQVGLIDSRGDSPAIRLGERRRDGVNL